MSKKTPGSGRQKGTPNKKTQSLLEVCEEMGVDPWRALLTLCEDEDPTIRGPAVKEACQYLYPKRRAVEVSGPEGGPIDTKTSFNSSCLDELKNLIETGLSEKGKA